MYFTKNQMKAIWFLIAILSAAIGYQYLNVWLLDSAEYDFSEFDKKFIQRRDSILALNASDSIGTGGQIDEASSRSVNEEGSIRTIQYPININTANITDLQALPRIGPKMAERIIIFRQENGRFQRKEDLIKVRGIGEKTFANLKDLITIQ